jgi:hypothetical protein
VTGPRPSAVPALLLLVGVGLAPPGAIAQERVLLRRYADVVAVRERSDGPEEVLYYFDPTRELPQGAQVQQGSGGFSELHLSGGAVIAAHASAHLVLERLGPQGDVVRVPMLSLLEVSGGTRKLELVLPGGTRCELLDSRLQIDVLPGRLRIRNKRGDAARVTGLIGMSPTPGDEDPTEPGRGRVELPAGQELSIHLYSDDLPAAGMAARRWAGRLVRQGAGAVLTADGARLSVGRESDGALAQAAVVEIGGVYTRPGPGRLVVADPRPMAEPGPLERIDPPAPAPPAKPAGPGQEPGRAPGKPPGQPPGQSPGQPGQGPGDPAPDESDSSPGPAPSDHAPRPPPEEDSP